jgi:hypothetical protein
LPKKTKVRVRHKHFLAFLKRDFFFGAKKPFPPKQLVMSSLFGNAFHEGLNRESKEKWEREKSIV